MFDGFYFEFPKLLFVVFFFIACATLCKLKLPSIYFPHTAQFVKESASASKLLFFLKWLGIVMLVLALMSPVKDEEIQVKPDQGYDIALVIDASQSMSAKGFDENDRSLNRFDVVQSIVGDFIKERTNDNLGVVVFGKYSFVAAPLTYDQKILKQVVAQLYIGIAGKFTALYEAIAQSVNLMKESRAKSKIAIVLTDGHNTPGGKVPLEVALELAKKEKIKVYTIGIGGANEYNGALLNEIAVETGGVAFGAGSAKELKKVYAKIDELEKSEIDTNSYTYKSYYYLYPVFIGFFSLLFYIYLRNKRGWA
ncbi:MAG: VWA domain-containing protein [Campylobacterota bacterium]|nr:VWA domain-containing protein [Campylobacterota bacterium]